jgi:hypothetical protein
MDGIEREREMSSNNLRMRAFVGRRVSLRLPAPLGLALSNGFATISSWNSLCSATSAQELPTAALVGRLSSLCACEIEPCEGDELASSVSSAQGCLHLQGRPMHGTVASLS